MKRRIEDLSFEDLMTFKMVSEILDCFDNEANVGNDFPEELRATLHKLGHAVVEDALTDPCCDDRSWPHLLCVVTRVAAEQGFIAGLRAHKLDLGDKFPRDSIEPYSDEKLRQEFVDFEENREKLKVAWMRGLLSQGEEEHGH